MSSSGVETPAGRSGSASEGLAAVGAASAEDAVFSATFWGVRGSIACPGPDTVRYGGNTPCVEVTCGEHILILDAGTGIRALGAHLMHENKREFDIFLTHTHFDHINGLPFFIPAFAAQNHIRVWAGHLAPERKIQAILQYMMADPLFPIPVEALTAQIEYRDFIAGDTLEPWQGVKLRTAPLNHPNRATGYRVDYREKSICYITDTEHPGEGLDRNIVELVRGADFVIYDAMFSEHEYEAGTRGWGHSTWEAGLRLADAAEVRTFVIFHHAPQRTDHELDLLAARVHRHRPGTLVAREGMVLQP